MDGLDGGHLGGSGSRGPAPLEVEKLHEERKAHGEVDGAPFDVPSEALGYQHDADEQEKAEGRPLHRGVPVKVTRTAAFSMVHKFSNSMF